MAEKDLISKKWPGGGGVAITGTYVSGLLVGWVPDVQDPFLRDRIFFSKKGPLKKVTRDGADS